jgi:hypothetical protein
MTTALRSSALLAALLAAGCATTGPASRPSAPRPAMAQLTVVDRDAAWAAALRVFGERGDDVQLADPARGLLVTAPKELQAPCGVRTCLARDTVQVWIGGTQAQLVIERRIFDDAVRAFLPPQDEAAVQAVERDQVALLAQIAGGSPELRLSRAGEHCGFASECDAGLRCVAARCQ